MVKKLYVGDLHVMEYLDYVRSNQRQYLFQQIIFLWANPGLFFIYPVFSNKHTILTTNIYEKCPSSTRRRDLNSQPSDYKSPPLTTRPGLPPNFSKCLRRIFKNAKKETNREWVVITFCTTVHLAFLTPIKAVLLFRRIRNVCLLNFSPLLLSNFGQTKLIPRRSVTVCETLTNCNDEMLVFLKMANPDLFFVLFSFQHQTQFQFQHCKSKKALMICLGFEPG